jgi:hypothetical protein
MVRVRTDRGAEGWVDSLQLLSPDQMNQIREERRKAASLPSEGTATAYEALNVHIEPDRQSPAFTQIPEAGSLTILGHKIAPKLPAAPARPAGFVLSRPQTPGRKQRREQQGRAASFRLPPKPAAPKAPANWQELSAERIDKDADEVRPEKSVSPNPPVKGKPQPPAKPVVMEDWTLIRTKNNQSGWVLSRNLQMSIPDEVAQYAEGKRITSFFDMGLVNDEEKGQKHNWLWTTATQALPFDFDGWRVFLWNARRHRYETSYRTRDLEGYFPVTVDRPDPGSPLRNFEIITKDDYGKMRRRTYVFDGHLVHLTGTEDYNSATESAGKKASALDPKELQNKVGKPSWIRRQWDNIRRRLRG